MALLFTAGHVNAKVALPAVFSDNMVLQQKTDAAVWGKAVPGKTIEISTTWSDKRYTAKADTDGNWKIKVATPAYGGPYVMTISDGEPTILKNILIGEVWVCSGQSNMEMPLAGWGKINDYQKEVEQARYPAIRLLQAVHVTSNSPLADAKVTNHGWKPCTPQYVAEFSSVAYFFAREIYKKTGIPVGLIHTSWGGTVAEAWTSAETLQKRTDFTEALAQVRSSGPEDKKNYEIKLTAWNQLVIAKDQGYNQGVPVWNDKSVNTSDWAEMKIPAYLENTLPDLDGVVWFQKKVIVPARMAGKALKLNLGPVDDNDITWFNGVKVGETKGYNVDRIYTIPAGLVKAGENTLTVRVFDGSGGGGIYGRPELLNLVDGTGEKISITGSWKYKVGLDLKNITPMPVPNDGPNRPAVLFNAMINPFIQYSIRGAIWYQGESNAQRAHQYRTLFPAMITDWRAKWKQGDFPFYFVQLANYMKPAVKPGSSAWAELRDAQLQTLSLPQTGMAVAIDLGDADDIHPKNKQEVGRRLALIALAKDYGYKTPYSGPVFASQKISGAAITISFKQADKGLRTHENDELNGFAIAGKDQVYYWAKAVIQGNKVVVSSTEVKDPVSVRYAWGNNPEANLYNGAGLPASPFRTDQLADSTIPVK